jgi:hypothetical protein
MAILGRNHKSAFGTTGAKSVWQNSKTLIFAYSATIRYGHFLQQALNMTDNPENSPKQSLQAPADPSVTAVRRIDVTGYEPANVFVPIEATDRPVNGASTVE